MSAPKLTPMQREDIIRHAREHARGITVRNLHRWAVGRGYPVSVALCGQIHKEAGIRSPPRGAPPKQAQIEPEKAEEPGDLAARVATLEADVRRLVDRLEALLTLPKVDLKDVAPAAVGALQRLLADPAVDPKARVQAAAHLPDLLRLAKEIEDGDGGSDLPDSGV